MIKIIDLYSGNDFDPIKIKLDGYSGVIFKAGQGAWADVPRYHPDWWKLAKQHGLLRGWYWLCDSRHKSAAHIDEMKAWKVLDDVGELGLWVDVEKPMIAMTEATYYKTTYAGHANVVDFCYLLTLQGITPGIYTGPGAYELIMRNAPKSAHDYLAKFDLWTAQYPYRYVEGVSKPTMYGSFTNWRWWQYREGPDINLYNGTDAQFELEYGSITTEPPTEDAMTDTKYKGTVLVSGLNIRAGASASTASLGSLQPNDKVEASAITSGWWKLNAITRGITTVNLPAADCYAYQGATNGYIRLDVTLPDVVVPPVVSEKHHLKVDVDGVIVYESDF